MMLVSRITVTIILHVSQVIILIGCSSGFMIQPSTPFALIRYPELQQKELSKCADVPAKITSVKDSKLTFLGKALLWTVNDSSETERSESCKRGEFE